MNMGYLLYQAERPKSDCEQREIDRRKGEMAQTLAGWWQESVQRLRNVTGP